MKSIVLYITIILSLSLSFESNAQCPPAFGGGWYCAGQRVSVGTTIYEAKWCTNLYPPSNSGQWDAWINRGGCCPALNRGSGWNGSRTICQGTSTNISSAQNASGGSSIQYRWYYRYYNGSTWSGWALAPGTNTGASYNTPNNLTPGWTHRYKRQARSSCQGWGWSGGQADIYVNSNANNPGIISVPATSCQGTAVTITNNQSASTGSPSSGAALYQHYYRGGPSNVGWTMYLQTSSPTATLPTTVTNTPGTWWVARNSKFPCSGWTNNGNTLNKQIIIQSNANNPGIISVPATICQGTAVTITNNQSASTGSPSSGTALYRHYYRGGPSNVGWTMYLETSSPTATLPAAVTNTAGTWYVARNSKFPCSGWTNNGNTLDKQIIVQSTANNPGIISVPATSCEGTAVSITNIQSASTGSPSSGAALYRHYYRGGPSSVGWTMYSETASTTATLPTAVTNTPGTWYVRRDSKFPCTGWTNDANTFDKQIIIQSTTNNPGAISVPAAICAGTATNVSNVTAATTGSPASTGPTYYYYYRGGPSNVGWTVFATTTSTSAALPAAVINTAGNWFVARNSEFGCASQANNASTYDIPITVDPQSVGGSISGSASVCSGSNSGTLTLSGHTGSVVKWQKNENGAGWVDITNPTTTQSYNNVTVNTEYRAIVQAAGLCSSATSASATLTVDANTVAGSISSDATVCEGTNSGTLTLSGHTGGVVKWQSNENAAGWVDITNTTTSQAYTNLTLSTEYRAVVQSGVCSSGTATSATITVTPTLDPGSINFE